jgi:hypothetical protein
MASIGCHDSFRCATSGRYFPPLLCPLLLCPLLPPPILRPLELPLRIEKVHPPLLAGWAVGVKQIG